MADPNDQGEVIPGPWAWATALIESLKEALRRTIASLQTCPYCQPRTYLRRHEGGCGVPMVLEAVKGWQEERH